MRKFQQRHRGSTSTEQLTVLALVGLVGAGGFGVLGGAMGHDIAGDSATQGPTPFAASIGAAAAEAEHGYTVQVIAYDSDDQARAQGFADQLRNQHGLDAFIEQNEYGYWVVRIHNVANYTEAQDILESYRSLGITSDAFIANHDGTLTPDQRTFLEAVAAQQEAEAAAANGAATGEGAATTDPTAAPTAAEEGDAAESESGDSGRGGGLFHGVMSFGRGLWDSVWDFGKGVLGAGKSIAWDFVVEDVFAGTIAGVAGVGCKVITLGHACHGSSWNPIKSTTDSVWNFVKHIPDARHVVGDFLHQTSLCLNPWNGQAGGDRGYACGRAVGTVVEAVVGTKGAGAAMKAAGVGGRASVTVAGELEAGAASTATKTAVSTAGELGTGLIDDAARAGAGTADDAARAAAAAEDAAKAASAADDAARAASAADDVAAQTARIAADGASAADDAAQVVSRTSRLDYASRAEAVARDARVLSPEKYTKLNTQIETLKDLIARESTPVGEKSAALSKLQKAVDKLKADEAALREQGLLNDASASAASGASSSGASSSGASSGAASAGAGSASRPWWKRLFGLD
ncbi:MAG: SPOR domain-containing protein [Polyangiales bacterium]